MAEIKLAEEDYAALKLLDEKIDQMDAEEDDFLDEVTSAIQSTIGNVELRHYLEQRAESYSDDMWGEDLKLEVQDDIEMMLEGYRHGY